ncbi:hypothetical protein FQN60_004218 [Etheostoma spectabile]|uniref:Uncharacterized protein n=1 Tax=Etheostoma spectabile TaxID=54343 RepID=A0A5J5CWL3_9PERO|nr:hypothetical protein FQN60_004218 [Etheostoma spectabile]
MPTKSRIRPRTSNTKAIRNGGTHPPINLFSSMVEHRRPVVAERLLLIQLLPVLLGDRDQDQAHHKNHKPNRHQGRSQDVGPFPAVARKVQAADDDAACQEAAPGGHEVDGKPEFFTLAARCLCGPEGLAAGQAEHSALCAARGRQLVPGLGEGALSQRDVLWAAVHGLRDNSELFRGVKERTSPGPDGIGGWVLRNCAVQLADIFCFISQMSLQLHMNSWQENSIRLCPAVPYDPLLAFPVFSFLAIVLSRMQSDQQQLVDGLRTSSSHHVQTVGSLTPHLSLPITQRKKEVPPHIPVLPLETRPRPAYSAVSSPRLCPLVFVSSLRLISSPLVLSPSLFRLIVSFVLSPLSVLSPLLILSLLVTFLLCSRPLRRLRLSSPPSSPPSSLALVPYFVSFSCLLLPSPPFAPSFPVPLSVPPFFPSLFLFLSLPWFPVLVPFVYGPCTCIPRAPRSPLPCP